MSNSEHICEYLAYYVAFKQAPRFAVLIDGRWGVGKTYLIEAFLASVRTKEFQAVYVSLSGLGASAEIDRELFRATSGRSNWSCNGTAMPSVRNKARLDERFAAIRTVEDAGPYQRQCAWILTRPGGVLFNPATAVRGPKHVVKRGKTPVLAPDEARALLDTIDLTTPIGLRDRALIGLMVYTFARVGAATAMRVEDVYVQNRRLWVRLHEKGGKAVELPCHHNLEAYLHAYLDGTSIAGDGEGALFRTIGRGTGALTRTALPTANAYAMVRRRAKAAGIATQIGNHTFRATGITAYLKNGGTLERAAIANHASTRTTQLYDRRADEVNLDEIERILI